MILPNNLSLEDTNVLAMEWEAMRLYNKAENRYQSEMKAYENKKTTSQYNKLLKAFEGVTADFKSSLKYFKELYEINPSKKYASYLANIYARLDDKQKAEYYKSLSK